MRALRLVLGGVAVALMIGIVFVNWYDGRPASGFVAFCAGAFWVRFWLDLAAKR